MNKQILEKLVTDRLSVRAISDSTGKGYTTIRYWLRQHGLKTNPEKTKCFATNSLVNCACGRTYRYDPQKGHLPTRCNGCVTRRRQITIKRKIVILMGGKCVRCGYSKCLNALHFHHKNPGEKEIGVSRLYNRAWGLILKEVQKCILLCANCHAEAHAKTYPHLFRDDSSISGASE